MFQKILNFLVGNRRYFLTGLLLIMTVWFIYKCNTIPNEEPIEKITYNEFIEMVNEHKVDSVYYNKNNEWMTVTLYNTDTFDMSIQDRLNYSDYKSVDKRLVLYPETENFRQDLLVNDVLLQVVSEDATLFQLIQPYLVFIFPVIWIIMLFSMVKHQTSSDMSKDSIIQTSEVTFDDIIGHDEILDDIKFITKLIQDPTIGDKIGAKIPKGILFTGSPGCGKTLIAKAIAHEAGIPFLYINGSRCIDRFVGMGARNIREIFKIARENAPCILFIDEIDAIGKHRDDPKGTSENNQTIDELLTNLDGFKDRNDIFFIAATNKSPNELDEALVRSGRFDRHILVAPPRDWTVRKDLFDHYLAKFNISEDIDSTILSKQTIGFTGADIATICNEASIIALKNDKEFLDMNCVIEAIDQKLFDGSRSKKQQYEKDRQIIAYHEAGHAVMSYILGEPIARASIQSTVSGVGGAVMHEEKLNSLIKSKNDIENELYICYGGRAAEQIKFNEITIGAVNDIQQATDLISNYICEQGFDDKFGLISMNVLSQTHILNENDTLFRIRQMSIKFYNDSISMLLKNFEKVELLAEKLLEVETLNGQDIEELLSKI